MNVPSESPQAAVATPEPIRYKRKRCRNCDKKFPLTKPNRQFCTTACKNEYGRHGSAFGPLKIKLEKLVRKLVADESKRGWTTQLATLKAAGFVMRDELPAAGASLASQVVSLAELLAADQRTIRALYSRVRVLEAAVANFTPDPHPLKTYAGIGRARERKPKRAGSAPSPRRRKANTRA